MSGCLVDTRGLRPTSRPAGLLELPSPVEQTDAVRDVEAWRTMTPFDRLLLARARTEGLTLLTADAAIVEEGPAHVRSARD